MMMQGTGTSFGYAMPHPNAPDNRTPIYSTTIAPNDIFPSQILSGVLHDLLVGNHMPRTVDSSACVHEFSADLS